MEVHCTPGLGGSSERGRLEELDDVAFWVFGHEEALPEPSRSDLGIDERNAAGRKTAKESVEARGDEGELLDALKKRWIVRVCENGRERPRALARDELQVEAGDVEDLGANAMLGPRKRGAWGEAESVAVPATGGLKVSDGNGNHRGSETRGPRRDARNAEDGHDADDRRYEPVCHTNAVP